jgi:hypothetical protein
MQGLRQTKIPDLQQMQFVLYVSSYGRKAARIGGGMIH